MPVWDSYDEVRSKMAAFLHQAGSPNQAQLKTTDYGGIKHSQSLHRFRARKGSYNGIKKVIYYAAYVFFKKLRIGEGK